jgi:hypothetical protein
MNAFQVPKARPGLTRVEVVIAVVVTVSVTACIILGVQ